MFHSWSTANNFVEEGLPKFSSHFQNEIHPVAVSHLDDVQLMLEPCPIQFHANEFQEMFVESLPKMEQALDKELFALERYAQRRWPDFQRSLERIGFDQQRMIVEGLEELVGEERAEKVNKMYEVELRTPLRRLFS